jgi:hypothetical protein
MAENITEISRLLFRFEFSFYEYHPNTSTITWVDPNAFATVI